MVAHTFDNGIVDENSSFTKAREIHLLPMHEHGHEHW